ncbi:unnamed protein product [Rotaria magnacalcarata]|uniref:Uncharacterized protein n=2 Tax=Rotaria magnacalcarata TaxID=392030 RepID=A0A814T6N7_9BILA|nr:unnamed protein product [Rotaria magnacalcarata]CAF1680361.1 unnamed protein product [Rotaria magnacalcarata]CAF4140968.1 unnamed protein product [Rotaria magnacalcarata]
MGVNELTRLEQIVISQLEQIRQNAAKIEKLTVNQNSEWKFVIRHLETVLNDSDNLMLKTADALQQIKNLSGLSETDCKEQRSLILRLNTEYLQTLQRFSTAQRIGCQLFNRINDQVPHESEQELRPVKQIEVKTYNREPIQVPKNKTIDRDRNKQWLTKEIQTAPIRSFNDFLFDATWNVPKFFDDDRLRKAASHYFPLDFSSTETYRRLTMEIHLHPNPQKLLPLFLISLQLPSSFTIQAF